MLGFITFIALLNIGLGYALALFLHGSNGRTIQQFVADLCGKRSNPAEQAIVAERAAHTDGLATTKAEPATSPLSTTRTETAVAPTPSVVDATPQKGVRSTGLVTLDYVDQLLTELTKAGEFTETPVSVVLMELDPVDSANSVTSDRLLAGIAETVNGLLDETQTAARFADQRFFLLLPGDDESQATQRAEQVRQRIEATEYIADGDRIHATVTCALAEVPTGFTTNQLVETLQTALARAKNLGGNRTYMFDGLAPAPVVPPELNLSPQKCAI